MPEYKSENEHRLEICEAGRWLHQKGFVAASDGNLSVRLPDKRVLCTPTMMSKGMMRPEDLVITDLSGRKLEGARNVSSEIAMHLLIYDRRPDVHGIVHAHPPTATGYAAAGLPLNKALISEVVLALGCVPLARYGTPGTPELSDALKGLVPHYDAILMANHGVVCSGETLLEAYFKMETVEHFARISLVTEMLGQQNLLSEGDVQKLMEAPRQYFGMDTIPLRVAGCPTAANREGETDRMAPDAETSSDRIRLTKDELKRLIGEVLQKV
jgi:L-fuculose-phosphate aldolase